MPRLFPENDLDVLRRVAELMCVAARTAPLLLIRISNSNVRKLGSDVIRNVRGVGWRVTGSS